jgi:archaellum biogenesis ATPase FlaH
MFDSLEDLAHVSAAQSLLITDTLRAEGNFLLHHFLNSALRRGDKVLFVGVEQSCFHYSSVSKKLSVNLATHLQQGSLQFVNALTVPAAKFALPVTLATTPGTRSWTSDGTCKSLFKLLQDFVVSCGASPCCILIDNLSLLEQSTTDMPSFLQSCSALLSAHKRVKLVSLLHADVNEDRAVLEHASQLADLVLNVQGLESGHSPDVAGQVCSVSRSRSFSR